MPRDDSGVYSLPPGYLATTGQTITTTQHNPPLEDIASALTNSVPRNGAAPMLAPLNMGGFRVGNAAAGSADSDYVTMGQLNAVIATVSALLPSGARLGFFMTSAPTGWVIGNGGTIGSAASGATTRANADTQSLFNLFWAQFNDATLPIQTSAGAASTRGASAAADWAANKRMTIFDLRNEFDRGADLGRGIDATLTVGKFQADEIKTHTHTGTADAAAPAAPTVKSLASSTSVTGTIDPNVLTLSTGAGTTFPNVIGGLSHTHPLTIVATGGTETRPRSVASLPCIKL